MPTTIARRKFMPMAIHYFLRQDYPDAELLIIDDSTTPIGPLWPDGSDIRYINGLRLFSSLGAKRNYACSIAAGNIIVHLDDDDWYAPDWISRQVAALQNSEADICGLDKLNFYNPQQQQCWEYIYPGNTLKPWVAGATMAYKKALWERNPFPDIHVGEDNRFVWSDKVQRVALLDDTIGFVSILHSGNTSPKYTNDRRWHPISLERITQILGNDNCFYQCHQDPQ